MAQAEGAVADTFLAAFAQRSRCHLARANARPWLFGILTGDRVLHLRYRVRRLG
jgi:RNA polymerase sigma-70 factor (ECF subfamily)